MAADERDPATLRLVYEDAIRERDRLRDARGSVTRQLGPLPASAGLAVTVVAAVADNVRSGYLWTAATLLALLVLVSIGFSLLRPYRRLRAEHEREHGQIPDDLPEAEWLERRIGQERALYGAPRPDGPDFRLRLRARDLQEAFDAERTGLYLVQLLFVAVVVTLVLGVVDGS